MGEEYIWLANYLQFTFLTDPSYGWPASVLSTVIDPRHTP